MEVLSVKDLSFKYPDSEKQVIENIGLTIGEGELVVLCGNTGSGKSTLLRLLKEELRPVGELRGDISYSNPESRIGFVMQNPHEQAVTDKVWHELAFGMENLGFSQEKMASRAAELSAYFGIEEWYDKSVNELSGGQLQLLNLASVMAMDPDILILDEPTAQLDPIAASQLISAIVKLHSDFALTVIIAEHRLEELLPVCDRMIVLEDARIKCNGRVKDVIGNILPGAGIYGALPAPYRLYGMLKNPGNEQKNINKAPDPDLCPLTVNDGRELLRQCLKTAGTSGIIQESNVTVDKPDDTGIKLLKRPAAIEMQQIYFRYGKENEDALSGLDLTVYTGEVFCLLGGNGSGKTTALGVAAGLLKPYSGSVKIFGKKIKEYKPYLSII